VKDREINGTDCAERCECGLAGVISERILEELATVAVTSKENDPEKTGRGGFNHSYFSRVALDCNED
jgi:hypothetical protein